MKNAKKKQTKTINTDKTKVSDSATKNATKILGQFYKTG